MPRRIWSKDASAWKSDPEHQKIIGNALGWLDVTKLLLMNAENLKAFAEEIRSEGFEYAVVLGMGGSSLCPEVFARSFGKLDGYPRLYVLDSTVVGAVRALEAKIQVEKTLFIVASKSGTTTEPRMFHRYFYARVKEKLGDKAGRNFVAITDPDTQLTTDAAQRQLPASVSEPLRHRRTLFGALVFRHGSVGRHGRRCPAAAGAGGSHGAGVRRIRGRRKTIRLSGLAPCWPVARSRAATS